MRKFPTLSRILVPFTLVFLGLITSCSAQEVKVTASEQGVTIARRGVSLLPMMTDTAVEIFMTPSETSAPIINTDVPVPPTETPTVPGSGPTRTTEPTSADVATESPATLTSSPTPEPIVCQGGVNRALEAEVINLINQERSKAGLTPLADQSQLTQTARSHAEDMACNDFFDHTSPTAGGVVDRVTAQGYDFSAVGEIIAGGFVEGEAVVAGWMSSPDHSKNILSRDFTQIGVGFAEWEDSSYGTYWVVVFGKPAP